MSERTVNVAYSFSSPSNDITINGFRTPRTPKLQDIEGFGTMNGNNFNFEYSDATVVTRGKKLGLKIQDTEEGNGVKIIGVDEGSAAATAGLKADDIVTEIGGKKITNTDEARAQLQENKDKTNYNVKAKRSGSEMSFDIKIPKKLKTANL